MLKFTLITCRSCPFYCPHNSFIFLYHNREENENRQMIGCVIAGDIVMSLKFVNDLLKKFSTVVQFQSLAISFFPWLGVTILNLLQDAGKG